MGKALSGVVGYTNATVEDRSAVLRALTWHAQGMDFTDALHLASAREAMAFATFDRELAAAATSRSAAPAVRLLGSADSSGCR